MPTCSQQTTHKYLPKLQLPLLVMFTVLFRKNTLKQKQTTAWRANGTLNEGNEKGEGGREKNARKKPTASSNMIFWNQRCCVINIIIIIIIFQPSSKAFPKKGLILIIRRLLPFLFYFAFHLCGGRRISGACDSFDRPPHLSSQAHVKLSQLWLRSPHPITARGTKGTSERGKSPVCGEGCELKHSS